MQLRATHKMHPIQTINEGANSSAICLGDVCQAPEQRNGELGEKREEGRRAGATPWGGKLIRRWWLGRGVGKEV